MDFVIWKAVSSALTEAFGSVDYVDVWKATSIVFTGGFGILGLLKEFKNKETGKVTRWGWVSLAGIVVSCTFGVAAQIKESSDQQRARDITAQQTLSLAGKTDRTVRDIERLLSPLDSPRFSLYFLLPCDDAKYQAFCSAAAKSRNSRGGTSPPSCWDEWPDVTPSLFVEIHFFANPENARDFRPGLMGAQIAGDLIFLLKANVHDKSLQQFASFPDPSTSISIEYTPGPSDTITTGKIRSVLDLQGTTMFITAVPPDLPTLGELQLVAFSLKLKNGQEIYTDPKRIEKITLQGGTAYRYIFP